MTMIDDEILTAALAELAGEFEVPVGGAEAILERAMAAETAPAVTGSRPLPVRPARRHKLLAVAAVAAVVALLVGVSTPTFLGKKVASGPAHGIAAGQAIGAPSGDGGISPGAPTYGATSGSSSASAANTPNGDFAPNQALKEAGPQGAASSPASTVPANLPPGVGSNQSIQKTGSVSLTVSRGRFSAVMNRLTALASGSGGFVSNTETNQDTGTPSGSITLEVPVADFETVLDQVRSLGKVGSVSTQAVNVTGQVVDIQSRIQALQDSLSQYEKILSQATSISDILTVQNQIDSIQSQIEQLQGQQNLLNASTLYSTLSVSVAETGAPHTPSPPTPPTGIGRAWHDAVSGFTGGFDGLVSIAGPLAFALLCLVAVLVIGRLVWRAARRCLI